MTLIRPLNKGQGQSFWYQSISSMRLPIGCQLNSNAPFSHNTFRTETYRRRQTQHCSISATFSTVG